MFAFANTTSLYYDALSNTKTIKYQLKMGDTMDMRAKARIHKPRIRTVHTPLERDGKTIQYRKKFAFSFVELNLLNNNSLDARWQNDNWDAMRCTICYSSEANLVQTYACSLERMNFFSSLVCFFLFRLKFPWIISLRVKQLSSSHLNGCVLMLSNDENE